MQKLLKVGHIERFHTHNLDQEDVDTLESKYDPHHLILEDLIESNIQDKIDTYDDHLFLVLHYPKYDRRNKIHTINELKVILWKGFLVTIMNLKTSVIDIIKQEYDLELAEDKEEWDVYAHKISPYYILYRIIDAIYDKLLYGSRLFTRDLTKIETIIFNQKQETVDALEELLKKKRSIMTLKACLEPQSEIITELQKETEKLYGWELDVYFEDLLYKIDKINNLISNNEKEVDTLYDIANTMTNIQINQTMKIFTIFAWVIWVLTFLSWLYGMNVPLPGQDHEYMFYTILILMAVIIGLLLWIFKKKGWMR